MLRSLVTFLGLVLPLSCWAEESLAMFGWFADVVGSCWQGTFPDGKTRHTHCYTSQFGQFIRGTATLAGDHNGVVEDQFFGDSVFAWDDSAQRITYYIWGSDGSHSRHEAMYEGEHLAFPIYSRKEPGKIAYRSLWLRRGRDSIEVQRQVPDGEGWRTELTVNYQRKPLQ